MESFSVPMPTVRCIPFTGWWRFRNGPKGRSEGASLLRKILPDKDEHGTPESRREHRPRASGWRSENGPRPTTR